ncbi:serine hydrolase [Litoribacter ruber]|uniref:serine hydrolase domain-containing protein n=1 Tax=Litoribacter ruber TaxID=702568 RepID=UPI001BD9386C|nr:serine hydrolase [Litoribacter ruber]MBT0810284.1 serine hydrolase [Litoribacter ruber]
MKQILALTYCFLISALSMGQSQLPEKEFYTEEKQNAIQKRANQMERLNSLLILKNDSLVFENYYNEFEKTGFSNVKSGSKSILNLLIGLAIENGYIESIDQPIKDFLPHLFHDDLDSRKEEITIRHLMLMQSGLEPTSLSNYAPWVASDDWLQFALDQELEADPGTLYGYSTGDTHLLSAALSHAVGVPSDEFALKYLYEPMGITPGKWSKDPQGYNEGGNNIHLRPRDFAKIGVLVKKKGVFNGKQIVSEEWIEESISFQTEPQGISRPFEILGYGYLWWLIEAAGYPTYCAIGFGGQYMMTIPDLDMIIVLTSRPKGSAPSSHFASIADLIENYIIKYSEPT